MSNFDPFKLYRKTYKQSHRGQVLQKKPVDPKRAYSRKDLTEAYKVLDAYRIPYGIQPAPSAHQFQTYVICDTFTSEYKDLNLNIPTTFSNTEFYPQFQLSEVYSELVSLASSYPDQVYHIFIICSFPDLIIRTLTQSSGYSVSYTMQFNQIQSSSFSPTQPITINSATMLTNIPFSPRDDSNVIYSAPLNGSSNYTGLTTTVNASKSVMAYNDEELPLSLLVDADAFASAFDDVIFTITRTSDSPAFVNYGVAINYNLTVVMAPVIDN